MERKFSSRKTINHCSSCCRCLQVSSVNFPNATWPGQISRKRRHRHRRRRRQRWRLSGSHLSYENTPEMGNNTEVDISQIPGYKFAGQWQLNVKGWSGVTLTIAVILLFILSLFLGLMLHGLITGVKEFSFSISAGELIFLLLPAGVIAATIILHEAVHGFMFLAMGSKPRFGFRLLGRFFPVAYVTSSRLLSRNRYLLVCLSPFLIITAISFVVSIIAASSGIILLALLAMAMNISGSIGDLIAGRNILRHNRAILFEDTQDGFTCYSPLMSGHSQ
jgi:hypothetical protein